MLVTSVVVGDGSRDRWEAILSRTSLPSRRGREMGVAVVMLIEGWLEIEKDLLC